MMKFCVTFLIYMSVLTSNCQYFDNGIDLKKIYKEGIYYVKTGSKKIDDTFIDALKKYWKVSKVSIINKYQVKKDMVFIGEYFFSIEYSNPKNRSGDYRGISIRTILNYDHFKSRKAVICRMSFNGFLGGKRPYNTFISLIDKIILIPIIVKSLNYGIELAVKNNLKSKPYVYGLSFYKILSKQNRNLKGLRLIIPERKTKGNSTFFSKEFRKLKNINYKIVPIDSLPYIISKANTQDCILHWGESLIGTGLSGKGFGPGCRSVIRIHSGEIVLSEVTGKMASSPYFDSPTSFFRKCKKWFKKLEYNK